MKKIIKPCSAPAAITALAVPYISQFKPDAMKVLVGCEESGRVRNAFVEVGHDAISCDIVDSSDPTGWHIKDDLLNHLDGDWDMVLAYPPCTYLTNSAAWAFKDPDYERYPEIGYHQRVKEGTLTGEARRIARDEALAFVLKIWESDIPKKCIENPRGSLSTLWRKPDQIIQPWWFGDPESKATCLWLEGLAPLIPTNKLDIEEHGWLAPNRTWRWQNQTASGQSNLPPTHDRDIIRSKTYHGIAQAKAQQWG